MERRKALATAGAVTATALAATIALGANLGLFGLATSEAGPGTLEPVSSTTKPAPRTEVIDIPVPVEVGSTGGGGAGSSGVAPGGETAPAPTAEPSPPTAAPSGSTAHESDDDGIEHDDEHEQPEIEHPEVPDDDD
jgi:hypothetical protein